MPRPRERIDPRPRRPANARPARLVLIDVYDGRNMAGVERGEIKKLLVLESLPKPINFTGGMDPLTYGGTFTLERVLGTVPVEATARPTSSCRRCGALFFVALDENDLAVKRMQSFVTVQPGETTGCVGCHEQRTRDACCPAAALLALPRRPSRIEPIADCPDVFDFPRDIQPILDRHCVDCHGYEKTARGGPMRASVILTGDRGPMFSHAYFTLTVRRLFADGRNQPKSNYPPRTLGSSASRILKMLDGSHYGVQGRRPREEDAAAVDRGRRAVPGHLRRPGQRADRRLLAEQPGQHRQRLADDRGRRRGDRPPLRLLPSRATTILPRSLSDERGISFWRFDIDDPRLKLSRHIVFNLTRPEKSLMLLAPLAEAAGGFGLCRDEQRKPADVFADAQRPRLPEAAGDGRGRARRTWTRSSGSTCPASGRGRSTSAR